jgi:hypothetical protein
MSFTTLLAKEGRSKFVFCVLVVVCGEVSKSHAAPCVPLIDPAKSLLIRNLAVTESSVAEPLGDLGFSTTMRSMLSGADDLQDGLKGWFDQWLVRKVGRFPIPPRSPGLMAGLWPRREGHDEYDWSQAPFRLMAVVYRPDLSAEKTSAGELRLAYNLYLPYSGEPYDFSVIFEFALPRTRSASVWARTFAGLSELDYQTMGQPLAAIVKEVAKPENLLQLRTNDFFLGPMWELREFKLGADGKFQSVPVAQTPAGIFDETPDNAFLRWAILNSAAIMAGNYEIPYEFLGSSALAPDDSFEWFEQAWFLPRDLAKRLSLNTCNGCHTGTTQSRFQHLLPRWEFHESEISDFLKKDLIKRQESLTQLLCLEP